MTESETKTCPFCAEDIKAAAIKCKHCGSMLDGTRPGSEEQKVVHETKTFVIPLPEDSPAAQVSLDFGSSNKKFPRELFTALGYNMNGDHLNLTLGSLSRGLTYIWDSHKDYLLERLNDLGREGWELAEGWERTDEHGFLVNAADRFEFETVVTRGSRQVNGKPTLFGGPKTLHRITGAKFMMRRTIISRGE